MAKGEASPVQKATYTFEFGENESPNISTYAFVHNLGTRELLVSIRNPDGTAYRAQLKSVAQDENIVLVSKTDGLSFQNGETVVVIG